MDKRDKRKVRATLNEVMCRAQGRMEVAKDREQWATVGICADLYDLAWCMQQLVLDTKTEQGERRP